MQRSRRALLQRRALERVMSGRSRLYKVSLSLVLALWGFVFLISLWFSQGDGYRDSSTASPAGLSTWNETTLDHDEQSDSVELNKQADPVYSSEGVCTNGVESSILNGELLGEGNRHQASDEGTANYDTAVADQPELEKTSSAVKIDIDAPNNDRLPRAVPLGLDEFKSKTFSSKSKSLIGQAGGIKHRVEPGGTEYNYASAAKGAKVLAFNKEAKGASNIISRDKDKYLRNPCSAEEKFVDIELSEETLVDTIKIGNLEHYSSNLRDFELLGSLVYPTDEWVKLGNFTAANIKLAQRFDMEVPKWVRYIKLKLLNHYGSEFYCTVSVIEIFGVDAVERMLEDLISVNGDQKPATSHPESPDGDDLFDIDNEVEPQAAVESNVNSEVTKSDVPDPIKEVLHQQGSRMPGDTVLKILMQKVRSLDFSLSLLERYLEESNSRYGSIFKEFDTDMDGKELELQKIKEHIRNILENQDIIVKDVNNLISWQSLVSVQLDHLVRDNAILRSEVEKVREKQISVDNKGVVIFVVCVLFSLLALARLFIDILVSVYTAFSVHTTEKSRKFCLLSSSWVSLLVSCIIVLFILSI
ncbi:SUN domain-containing protein 4 isoform X2 [Argentina anserina]|uniref:SUN domain-containing protein 4 isoform X2 n=1 Tax=Argentina anserina TaxID=57926 RepID=UPI0021769004|nr:SUN domain-containing protein 4 isoform X2 [Potentilla anserina]